MYPELEDSNFYNELHRYDVYKLREHDKSINLDGYWVKLFDSTTKSIAAVFCVHNNVLDGDFVQYYISGNKRLTGSFYKNLYVGTWQYFRDNGTVYEINNYIVRQSQWGLNDFRFGEWRWWDENGTLRGISHYDSTGRNEGEWIEFYISGAKRIVRNYRKGLFNGYVASYFENGNYRYLFSYNDNYSITNGSIYYKTGSIEASGNTFEYCKINKWKFYHGNGRIKSTGKFKLHMTEVCMSSVPQNYYHSTKEGRWIYWYDNGNVMAYGDYLSRLIETSRGKIYKSRMVGEWTFFDENGNLVNFEYLKNKSSKLFEQDDAFLPEE